MIQTFIEILTQFFFRTNNYIIRFIRDVLAPWFEMIEKTQKKYLHKNSI